MEYFLLQKGIHQNPFKIVLSGEEIVVGRKSFATLRCSPLVSRTHASFQVTSSGDWFVKDLGSLNGVYINREKIGVGLHRLEIGNSIGFGVSEATSDEDFEFLFCSNSKIVQVKPEPNSESESEDIILKNSIAAESKMCKSENPEIKDPNVSSDDCILIEDDVLDPPEKIEADKAEVSHAQHLSTEQKYAHLLQGKYLKVVLEKIDSATFNSPQKISNCINVSSDDSNSSDENFLCKKMRLRNIDSSESSSSCSKNVQHKKMRLRNIESSESSSSCSKNVQRKKMRVKSIESSESSSSCSKNVQHKKMRLRNIESSESSSSCSKNVQRKKMRVKSIESSESSSSCSKNFLSNNKQIRFKHKVGFTHRMRRKYPQNVIGSDTSSDSEAENLIKSCENNLDNGNMKTIKNERNNQCVKTTKYLIKTSPPWTNENNDGNENMCAKSSICNEPESVFYNYDKGNKSNELTVNDRHQKPEIHNKSISKNDDPKILCPSLETLKTVALSEINAGSLTNGSIVVVKTEPATDANLEVSLETKSYVPVKNCSFIKSENRESNVGTKTTSDDDGSIIVVKTELATDANLEVSLETKSYVPLKDCSFIKSENRESNVGTKTTSDDDIDCFGYSQHDEVITILDDDDYLSFPMSQKKNDIGVVKREPAENEVDNLEWNYELEAKIPDVENKEIEYNGEMPVDNFVEQTEQRDRSSSSDSDRKAEPTKSTSINFEKAATTSEMCIDDHSDDSQMSENIEAIAKFVDSTKRVSIFNLQDLQTETNNSTIRSNAENVNDYFPVLSQAFFADSGPVEQENIPKPICASKFYSSNLSNADCRTTDSCESGNESSERHMYYSDEDESVVSKERNAQSAGRTLLTDPKPMVFRPRRQRGREEWFRDQYTTSKMKSTIQKTISEDKRPKVKSTNTQAQKKKSPRKKKHLKDKIREQMGHRIRVPNGGSAIPMKSNNQLKNALSKEPSRNSKAITANNVPKATISPSLKNNPVKKNSVVKKKPDRFGSRMIFLVDPIPQIKTNEKQKAKAVTTAKTIGEFKIPKLPKNRLETNKSNMSSTSEAKHGKIDECTKDNTEKSNAILKGKSFPLNELKFKNKQFMQQPDMSVNKNAFDKSRPTCSYSTSVPYEKSQATASNTILQTSPKFLNNWLPSSSLPSKYNSFAKNVNPEIPSVCHDYRELNNKVDCRQTYELVDPRLQPREHSKTLHNTQLSNQKFLEKDVHSKTRDVTKTTSKFNFDYMLSKILAWNPLWLKEQQRIGKPPPLTGAPMKLPLSFNSLDHYIMSFYPIILHELWEYLFQEWREYNDGNLICLMVTSYTAKDDIMVLECHSVVSSATNNFPREGNLLIVELRDQYKKEVIKVFGYVYNHKVRVLNSDRTFLHAEWFRRQETHTENALLYSFCVKTKKKTISLHLDKLMVANVLSYVANKVRLADALQYLKYSPLVQDILQPSEKTFRIVPSKRKIPSLFGQYNDAQSLAIASIWEEVRTRHMPPKLFLLQGPPGTGKTHTIVGLIEYLLLNKRNKVKILVTAPSNAAVDEIGRRLLYLKKKQVNSQADPIRFVRVGLSKLIHSDLVPYSLDELVRTNSKSSYKRQEETYVLEIKKKMELIEKLEKDISLMSIQSVSGKAIEEKKAMLEMEKRRYQYLKDENKKLNSKISNFDDPSFRFTKYRLLQKADVILSTLSSCRQSIVKSVFGEKSNLHFTCCIVDEATQCTEPEILQPLMFGLNKLILVGDHQQLPATVNSKFATECNYERSLFERVHLFFLQNKSRSPVFMLTKQYRMHSEICSFPSSYFYSKKLITPPEVDKRYRLFPIKPVTILNILEGQESDAQSSKANILEAKVITEICKHLLQTIPKEFTIGIITPYQGQKSLYLKEFKQISDLKNIEINTVDGFQGREKDIIIVSCVRARSASGSIGFLACRKRLNVAITRSRQCLIICGHTDSLKQDPDWAALIANAKQRKICISVTSLQDIPFVLDEIKNPKCRQI